MKHREHMIVVGELGRERDGYIKNLSDAQAKALEARLKAVMSEHGVDVHVMPVMVHSNQVSERLGGQ